MSAADHPRVHARTAAEWRRWLAANHAKAKGVWLVSWKAATGRQRLGYEDSIPDALAYGWIDSVIKPIDDERTALLFTPRRPGSGWSTSNKARVAALMKARRMRAAGRAVIDAAKRDGSWSKLDFVESMTVPHDLRRALGAAGVKRFEALTPGRRKEQLRTLVDARRPETRARRIAAIVRVVRA